MPASPYARAFDSDQLLALVPALRRYARALLRDAWLADDLVQDTLERAWHKQARFTIDTDLRAWTFAIMHNLFASQLRKRDPLRGADDDTALAAAPADAPADAVLTMQIMGLVERLPAEQRATLLLVSVEELSYADAARILGVPIGTVMSRLARARERLRAWTDETAVSGTSPAGHLRLVK